MSNEAPLEPPTVSVERFIAGGEGLARHGDGRVMFVRGGIPGDEVGVRILDDRREWLRAEVSGVVASSVDRIEPSCDQRLAGCGGCDWAEVADDRQLDHKMGIVADALRRTARVEMPLTRGRSVTRRSYRSSLRVIGDDSGHPCFRRTASSELVSAQGCEVAVESLRSLLDNITITAGLEVALRASLATGELTVRWDERSGSVAGVPANVGLGASARLVERVAGVDLVVSAGSFFQSGPQAAEVLVESVGELAPEVSSCRHLLDAYGGVGLFAATVGGSAGRVTLVESSRTAVADAQVNLAHRGPDASVVRCDVGDWRDAANAPSVDVAIADPARTGLGKPGVRALTRVRPGVLILISCDPVSMARDTALLDAAGYRLEQAVVHDLFPGTHHVEVVSRFIPAGTLTA